MTETALATEEPEEDEPIETGQLTLGELIATLEDEEPTLLLEVGFARPHSYRGFYDELAFEPAINVTVAAMLKDAKSALGHTFEGYKGGEFTMNEYTDCWLAYSGHGGGETIGRLLLHLMLKGGRS